MTVLQTPTRDPGEAPPRDQYWRGGAASNEPPSRDPSMDTISVDRIDSRPRAVIGVQHGIVGRSLQIPNERTVY
jgi:hypothetical protein